MCWGYQITMSSPLGTILVLLNVLIFEISGIRTWHSIANRCLLNSEKKYEHLRRLEIGSVTLFLIDSSQYIKTSINAHRLSVTNNMIFSYRIIQMLFVLLFIKYQINVEIFIFFSMVPRCENFCEWPPVDNFGFQLRLIGDVYSRWPHSDLMGLL